MPGNEADQSSGGGKSPASSTGGTFKGTQASTTGRAGAVVAGASGSGVGRDSAGIGITGVPDVSVAAEVTTDLRRGEERGFRSETVAATFLALGAPAGDAGRGWRGDWDARDWTVVSDFAGFDLADIPAFGERETELCGCGPDAAAATVGFLLRDGGEVGCGAGESAGGGDFFGEAFRAAGDFDDFMGQTMPPEGDPGRIEIGHSTAVTQRFWRIGAEGQAPARP